MDKSKGFIYLWRDIQGHYLSNEKPYDKFHAWIDLLLLANHKDNRFMLGNTFVSVERGSLITSELKLMNRWGWSKAKVRGFLNLLESDSMIIKKTDKKKTTITIVNYSVYQNSQTTEEPQKDHKKTAKRPQKDTNNNENNENNEIKREIVRHKYGECKNVLLTDEELEKLKSDFPSMWCEKLEDLSNYMKSTGKSYKDHYITIRSWIKKDMKEGGESHGEYSGEKGESFNLEDYL